LEATEPVGDATAESEGNIEENETFVMSTGENDNVLQHLQESIERELKTAEEIILQDVETEHRSSRAQNSTE